MDNALTVSQAIELVMLARGDAVMLSGQAVVLWGAAAAVGRRAVALPPRLALMLRKAGLARGGLPVGNKANVPVVARKSAMLRDYALAALVAKRELEAVAAEQVVELLLAGKMKSEGSRVSGGWREAVPPSEYLGLVIKDGNAVDRLTQRPKIFDVLIDGRALAEELGLLGTSEDVEVVAGIPTVNPEVDEEPPPHCDEAIKARRSPGRPTRKAEIVAAFEKLEGNCSRPMTSIYGDIRLEITGKRAKAPGLGDEAIRKVISRLWKSHKSSQ